MKKYIKSSLFALLFWLSGCGSSYSILKTKQDKDFRLSDYSTFGFYDIEASGDTLPANFESRTSVIKGAISKALQARGLDEARDANLKVNIALSVEEKQQTRETDFRTEGLPRYMGQRRYSWKSEEVVVGNYRQGTMLIDLVDSSNNKLVWQGGASGIIPEKDGSFNKNIQEAVDKIVSEIPK